MCVKIVQKQQFMTAQDAALTALSLLFVELNESSIVQYVYMVFSHYCSSPPQGCAHTVCKVTKVQAVTNFVLLNTHTPHP